VNDIASKEAFANLTPDQLLDAVETTGVRCDGRFLALNSYENRVYQIGMEEGAPLVAKFYRPNRWTDAAIIEEHRFTLALAEQEIPVVAPLLDDAGKEIWRKSVALGLVDIANSALLLPDGDFLVAGLTQVKSDQGLPLINIPVLRVSPAGEIRWQKQFSLPNNALAQSMKPTRDGNFILTGMGMRSQDFGTDLILLKISAQGDLLWEKFHGTDNGEYGNCVVPTSEGGYLVAGYSSRKVVQEGDQMSGTYYAGLNGYLALFNSLGEIE